MKWHCISVAEVTQRMMMMMMMMMMIIHCKSLEGGGCCLHSGTVKVFFWRDWGKPRKQ